jgi:Amt family ammonium transporter
MKFLSLGVAALVLGSLASPALAQSAADLQPATESSAFIFDTLLFLCAGAAAVLLAAGLGFREAGLVRAKSAGSVFVKTIAVMAIAGVMFWLVGYNLLYAVKPGGLLGEFAIWTADDLDPGARGHASGAFFFQQASLAAIAALIVGGALSERLRLWAFFVFAAFFSGVVYPVVASWDWGKGYLESAWGFADFGGAMLVHGAGGAGALAGAIVLGARLGRFDEDGEHDIPGSNLPLTALGGFFIWAAFLVLNAASRMSLSSIEDATAIADIIVNSNMAAGSGVIAAMLLTQFIYRKLDIVVIVNAGIGGLVAVAADPLSPSIWQAAIVGSFAGVLVATGGPALARLKIDDVSGVIPAHLFCGVWGALIVAWTNESASILGQAAGVCIVLLFAFVLCTLFFAALKYSFGLRLSPDQEYAGLDRIVVGRDAYLAED